MHSLPMAPPQELVAAALTCRLPVHSPTRSASDLHWAFEYSKQRRAIGESGDWFALGVFYDDFLSSELSFFGSTVWLASAAVFASYGVDIGDGSVYKFSGDTWGIKQWFGRPNEPMDALGANSTWMTHRNLYDLSYLFSGHSRGMQRVIDQSRDAGNTAILGTHCIEFADSNRPSCFVESRQVGRGPLSSLDRHRTSHSCSPQSF